MHFRDLELQLDWGLYDSFGYEAEHHAISMRMAELALQPAVRSAAAGTVIVAGGTSCRHQIRDGAAARPAHLAQRIAPAPQPVGVTPWPFVAGVQASPE